MDTEDWVGRYFLQWVGVGVLVGERRNGAPGMREGGKEFQGRVLGVVV